MVIVLPQELCPNCHVSFSTEAHPTSFFDDFDRAFSAICIPPIDASADSIDADLAMVTTEIDRLSKALQGLCEHRGRLQTHQNQLLAYSLSSAFRRLPTELLSHIFSFCCNSVKPGLWKTPVSISQTCFKWRRIALATPRMWSHLYIGPEICSRLPHLQKLFLQRAGSETPLSLRLHRRYCPFPDPVDIDDPETPKPDPDDNFETYCLLTEIFELSVRLVHLDLQISTQDCDLLSEVFSELDTPEFPLLESLSLALDCRFDNDERFPEIFMSAPRLRTISFVDEGGKSLQFFRHELPWDQLTHITTNLQSLCHLDALDDSEDLLERTIHWNCVSTDIFTSEQNANITSLVVSPQVWTKNLVIFFKFCRMSALRDLTIEETGGETYNPSWLNVLRALPKFVRASAHGLRSLRIVLSRDGEDALDEELDSDLLATLAYTPTLKTLQVVESVSGSWILTKELFEGILRDGLVPNLRHLELVWSPSHAMPEDSLLEMLTRQAGLESLVLGVREGGEVSKGVREFMKQGSNGLRATLW